MALMTYKGYTAEIEIDRDAKVLAGRVRDLRDVIVFEGNTVADIEREFHASIDDYLAWCAEQGREPDRAYSGRLPFRTKPEMHRKIARAAAEAGTSINAWMEQALTRAVDAARNHPQND